MTDLTGRLGLSGPLDEAQHRTVEECWEVDVGPDRVEEFAKALCDMLNERNVEFSIGLPTELVPVIEYIGDVKAFPLEQKAPLPEATWKKQMTERPNGMILFRWGYTMTTQRVVERHHSIFKTWLAPTTRSSDDRDRIVRKIEECWRLLGLPQPKVVYV